MMFLLDDTLQLSRRTRAPTTAAAVARPKIHRRDDINNFSMVYSEDDDSLSDAYFLPKSHGDGSAWEEGKQTAAASTELTTLIVPRRHHRGGRRPPPRAMIPRDVIWGLLFVLHILVLLVGAIRWGKLGSCWSSWLLVPVSSSLDDVTTADSRGDTIQTTNATTNAGPEIILHEPPVVDMVFGLGQSVRNVTVLAAGFAVLTSYLFASFLVLLDIAMIYIMLGLSNLIGLACVILGLSLEPYGGAAMAGMAVFATTLSYTVHAWNRVEFATVQLHTAVSALRPDMAMVSGMAMLALLGMVLLWEWASIGIIDALDLIKCEKAESTSCSLQHLTTAWHYIIPVAVAMLVSFLWIIFVVLNTVAVVVAGLTATWWFAPQYVPRGALATNVTVRSIWRALSVSFGSICLGSLVVGMPTMWLDSLFSVCCGQFGSATTKHGMILPASRSDGMLMAMTDEMEIHGAYRGFNRLCFGIRWYCSSWNKYAFCFVGMCE
jgi:Plasma-membrane choline transporter